MNKKYILRLVLLFLVSVILVFSINLYLNPYLTYNSYFDNKIVKYAYNEREQKALSLVYNKMEKYDTLLIGSSRVTYFNQTHFKHHEVFNFAVSDAIPFEYADIIKFARQHMPNLKTIIIGFDFQSSNKNYIKKEKFDFQKYNNLQTLLKRNISIDSLKYNLKDISLTIQNDYNSFRVYNNDNIVLYNEDKLNVQNFKLNNRELLVNYRYDNKLKLYLMKIKEENNDLDIKAFITPVSQYRKDKYLNIITTKEIKTFENEIASILNTKVYNFLINENIDTKISNYFMDTHHLIPRGCDILIKEIEK